MLEGVAVVLDVVVVVVGVGKEVLVLGEDVGRADVGGWQACLAGVADFVDLLGIVGKVLAQFVAQVGVGVLVAHHFHGVVGTHGTVVGGQDYAAIHGCQRAEEFGHGRMAEPTLRDAAVCRLAVGQFAHHAAFRSGMAEHVYEVEHHDVEVVMEERGQLLHELLGTGRVVYLVVGECVASAEAFQLRPHHGGFVEVFALLGVLVDPEVGEHGLYLYGHEPGEDGVSGILCGRGQYAAIHVFLHVEEFCHLGLKHLPLVPTEVVYDYEEDLLALVQGGEHLILEDVGAHEGAVFVLFVAHQSFHPLHVVLAHELAELVVCLALLHGQHLLHLCGNVLQFQFPTDQCAVDVHPVLHGEGVVYLHAQPSEVLLVGRLRGLADYFAAVYVLLE